MARNKVSRRPKGINWDDQPLGQSSDRALADLLGVTHGAVRAARVSRGIPAFRAGRWACSSRVDWDAQPLGQMPDAKLARALGMSTTAVRHARLSRGIAGYIVPLPTSAQPEQKRESQYVGSLCRRGHEFGNTGGSLRARGHGRCIACDRARLSKWRSDHGETYNEYMRRYMRAHPEIGRAAAKRFADRHPEKMIESRKRSAIRKAPGHLKQVRGILFDVNSGHWWLRKAMRDGNEET